MHLGSNDSDEGVFDITITGSDPIPEIAIEQPVGTNISNGGTKSMVVNMGNSTSLTFTIKSLGTDSLNGLAITKDGANASEFVVTSNPSATVQPSGTTTFAVSFTPTAGGARTATLHIANNDADENPFTFTLAGVALNLTQDSDNDGMSDAAEFQMATLGFNWQVSNAALVTTLNASANSAGLYTPSQIQALNVGVPLIQRDPVTSVFTITVGVQKSTDLIHFTPLPMTAPQTILNAEGKVEFSFTVPDNSAFFRLQSQ